MQTTEVCVDDDDDDDDEFGQGFDPSHCMKARVVLICWRGHLLFSILFPTKKCGAPVASSKSQGG